MCLYNSNVLCKSQDKSKDYRKGGEMISNWQKICILDSIPFQLFGDLVLAVLPFFPASLIIFLLNWMFFIRIQACSYFSPIKGEQQRKAHPCPQFPLQLHLLYSLSLWSELSQNSSRSPSPSPFFLIFLNIYQSDFHFDNGTQTALVIIKDCLTANGQPTVHISHDSRK